jgi:AcrR family transcriptional regulator
MGRKPNPDRKPELLDEVIAWLCDHGIGDLSLRPLAQALGVSTYALVYHFGSREGLLAEALGELERRQRAMIARWVEGGQPSTPELVRRYWEWCSAPENLPVMRLEIEATSLEGTRSGLPASLREGLVTDWVAVLAKGLGHDGLAAADARTTATLTNAALVGLALDLLATGDRRRTRRALEALVEQLRERIESSRLNAGDPARGTRPRARLRPARDRA